MDEKLKHFCPVLVNENSSHLKSLLWVKFILFEFIQAATLYNKHGCKNPISMHYQCLNFEYNDENTDIS